MGQLPWPVLELSSLAPLKKKEPQSLQVQDAAAQWDFWDPMAGEV